MKNPLVVIILFTASISIQAQQLEVAAAAGDFCENSSGSLSWTLGEVAIETLVGANLILTQGFQQSKLTVTTIDDMQLLGIELSVFPNPTNSHLFIDIKKKLIGQGTCSCNCLI